VKSTEATRGGPKGEGVADLEEERIKSRNGLGTSYEGLSSTKEGGEEKFLIKL